jgi:hypothetical protein
MRVALAFEEPERAAAEPRMPRFRRDEPIRAPREHAAPLPAPTWNWSVTLWPSEARGALLPR